MSRQKYFCSTKVTFVDKSNSVSTKVILSRQNYFCVDKSNFVLVSCSDGRRRAWSNRRVEASPTLDRDAVSRSRYCSPGYDAHRYIPAIIRYSWRLLYDLNTWKECSSPVRLYAERMQLSHGFAYAWRQCQYDCYTLLPTVITLLPTFIRFSYATYWHLLVIGGGADRLRQFWNFQNSRSRRWLQIRLLQTSLDCHTVSTCTIADSPRSTRTAQSWSIVAVSRECGEWGLSCAVKGLKCDVAAM